MYDANSERTKRGEAFEDFIIEELRKEPDVQDIVKVWEWLETEKGVTERAAKAAMSKSYGDITFLFKGERRFIECCSASGKWTTICNQKVEKFLGADRFYCVGLISENGSVMKYAFTASESMAKYLGQCPVKDRDGDLFREVKAELLTGMYVAKKSAKEFIAYLRNPTRRR